MTEAIDQDALLAGEHVRLAVPEAAQAAAGLAMASEFEPDVSNSERYADYFLVAGAMLEGTIRGHIRISAVAESGLRRPAYCEGKRKGGCNGPPIQTDELHIRTHIVENTRGKSKDESFKVYHIPCFVEHKLDYWKDVRPVQKPDRYTAGRMTAAEWQARFAGRPRVR